MKSKIIIIAVILFSTISCKKKGCTDPIATNYSSEAGKDDGSCTYAPTNHGLIIGEWHQDSSQTHLDATSVLASNINTDPVGLNTTEYTATNVLYHQAYGTITNDLGTYSWLDADRFILGTQTSTIHQISATTLVVDNSAYFAGYPNAFNRRYFHKL
jgi:hypothetical protein